MSEPSAKTAAILDDQICPKLVAKARLRRDVSEQRYVLLYPERGLFLNETAAEVLKRCDGKTRIVDLIEHFAEQEPELRSDIAQHIRDFILELHARGLMRLEGT